MLTSPFPLTGEYIVTANADDRSLSVVPVGLASVAATVPLPSAPGAIATAPNSDRVFVATPAAQALALASLNAGQVVAALSTDSHPDQLVGPPPGVDGSLLILSETDRTIRSLDPASQAFGPAIELGPGPHAIAMAIARPASVQQIYVTSAGEGRLDLLDAQATTLQRSLGVGGRPIGVTATSTGQLWIADASEGSVKQIDPSSGQTIQAIPVGPGLTGIAATPDGRYLVLSSSDAARALSSVDLFAQRVGRTEQVLHQLAVSGGVQAVATGIEITVAFATTSESKLLYWDLASNTISQSVEVGKRPIGLSIGLVKPDTGEAAATPGGGTLNTDSGNPGSLAGNAVGSVSGSGVAAGAGAGRASSDGGGAGGTGAAASGPGNAGISAASAASLAGGLTPAGPGSATPGNSGPNSGSGGITPGGVISADNAGGGGGGAINGSTNPTGGAGLLGTRPSSASGLADNGQPSVGGSSARSTTPAVGAPMTAAQVAVGASPNDSSTGGFSGGSSLPGGGAGNNDGGARVGSDGAATPGGITPPAAPSATPARKSPTTSGAVQSGPSKPAGTSSGQGTGSGVIVGSTTVTGSGQQATPAEPGQRVENDGDDSVHCSTREDAPILLAARLLHRLVGRSPEADRAAEDLACAAGQDDVTREQNTNRAGRDDRRPGPARQER
jgi:hypothetical protein